MPPSARLLHPQQDRRPRQRRVYTVRAGIRAATHSVNIEATSSSRASSQRFLESSRRAKAASKSTWWWTPSAASLPGELFKDLTAAGDACSSITDPVVHASRINNPHPSRADRRGRKSGSSAAPAGVLGYDHGQDGQKRRWRDTMFRVEGPAVRDLQAAFSGSWLETSGEVWRTWSTSAGARRRRQLGHGRGQLADRTLVAQRMIFQPCSPPPRNRSTSPRLLPARPLRARADPGSGTELEVASSCPAKHSDHLITRRSSRRLFRNLLRAGANLHYKPSDAPARPCSWTACGASWVDELTTDPSGINDELNLAVFDDGRRSAWRRLRGGPREQQGRQLPGLVAAVPHRARPRWLGWLLERQQ